MLCCGVCQYEGRHCAAMAPEGAMDAHLEEYRQQGFDFDAFTPQELWMRISGKWSPFSAAVRLPSSCQKVPLERVAARANLPALSCIAPECCPAAWRSQIARRPSGHLLPADCRHRHNTPNHVPFVGVSAGSPHAARCGSWASRRHGTGITWQSVSCQDPTLHHTGSCIQAARCG